MSNSQQAVAHLQTLFPSSGKSFTTCVKETLVFSRGHVSRKALVRAYQRKMQNKESDRDHLSMVLSREQEELFVLYLYALAACKAPVLRRNVHLEVLHLFNVEVSAGWVQRFLIRHKSELNYMQITK
jgi:hypothetical protein